MAKITKYDKQQISIPGLPDTTNITDPQLRLFLDRLKLCVQTLTISVNGLMNTAGSTDTIAENLSQNQNFNKIIDKKINNSYAGIAVHNRGADVIKKEINLNGINVYPDYIRINLVSGNSAWVTVDYIPSNVSDNQKGVTWSVSDGLVAEIDADGVVTALSEGECLITATSSYNAKFQANALLEVVSAALISVPAPFRWVAEDNIKSIYTGNDEPQSGEYIWADEINDVEIIPDAPEEESYAAAAYGNVSSVDRRDFIVTPDGLIYWRDKSKYGVLSYTPVEVIRSSVYGAGMYASAENGLMVYCEGWPHAGWNNTGRVFGKALDNYDEWSITNEQILEYAIENCLIAENVPFETDIHVFASKTGLFVIDWEGADFFVRVVERTDPDTGEITYFDSPYYDGLYATGESVTLDVPDSPSAEGYSVTFYETQTQDGKYEIWLGDYAAGRYFPGLHEKPRVVKKTVDGIDDYYYYEIEPGERYTFPDGSIGGFWFSCRNMSFNSGGSFVLDGKGYSTGGGYSWVFDVIPVYAWSLSPCFQDRMDVPQTIYTEVENPEAGTVYGLWDAENKIVTALDTVTSGGNGVYSITSADNETFYSTKKSEK